jgi:hypothetical protein
VDGSESGIWLAVAVVVAVQVLFSLGLHAWARWVATRQGGAAFWRRASWLPLIALVAVVVSTGLSVVFLIRAFTAVADADASEKARLLAENIGGAMNASAVLGLPSSLLYVASFSLCVFGSIRRPRA